MPFVIEQLGQQIPTFFSKKVGADLGSPMSGWSTELDKATVWEKQNDAEQFRQKHMLPGKVANRG